MEKFIREVLKKLSTAEKVKLCHGRSSMTAGKLPEHGIGEVTMADGPQGIRRENGKKNTALPCGLALAASWDVQLAEEYGALLAREALGSGIQVSLGPGLNLMRTPLNGRNFEYYGEDPVLAGRIAGGYVRGCQNTGVAAVPKHLALNNQEICRTIGDSRCDEKTLRELYLEGFEIVVRESFPWMMMSSYNLINGVQASACTYTQQTVMKDQCGFDGVMVSDWGGAHDAVTCALGGLDLEMGYGEESPLGLPLLQAVESGRVPMDVLDEMALRNLRLLYRLGAFENAPRTLPGAANTAENHALSGKIASECMVLLKNDRRTLPLNLDSVKIIALIGPSADYLHSMGALEQCGGSGAVHPEYEITPLAALREVLDNRKDIEIIHEPGVRFDSEWLIADSMLSQADGRPGLRAEYRAFDPEKKQMGDLLESRTETHLELIYGIRFAAGIEREDNLSGRMFHADFSGFITPERSGMAELMIVASRLRVKLFIDGVEIERTSGPEAQQVQRYYRFSAETGRRYAIRIEAERTSLERTELKLLWRDHADELFDRALSAAGKADLVLYFGGTNHAYDKEAIGWGDVAHADIPDLELPHHQSKLIRALAEVNDNLVVSLINGSVVDVEDWIDSVPALLECFYPGMESGRSIMAVLTGKVNPSGKLPFTWAKQLNDYPCHANGNYPGVRTGEHPYVNYDEGIFIGYRHFDRGSIPVRFPFGHGLSYTTFHCRLVDVTTNDGVVCTRVSVENTGKCAGCETIQLYLENNAAPEERPCRVLRSFVKVRLEPGEERMVALRLDQRDFAVYHASERCYRNFPGKYRLHFGTSSRDFFALHELEL